MNYTNLIVYYGTETPALGKTHELENSIVVLQDYHPLVQQRAFADYFPKADRFLYFNCCKIPLISHGLPLSEAKYARFDPKWNCLILDLKRKAHREHLLKKALSLIEFEGVCGFFIDDLDLWGNNPQDQKAMVTLLNELESILPPNIFYIFNRGFPFWGSFSQRLKAVMIEDVGFSSCIKLSTNDQKWLEQTLSIHVPLILHKSENVSVFFFEYESTEIKSQQTTNSLESLFREFQKKKPIHFLTKQTRDLNQWPLPLQNQTQRRSM